LWSAAECPYSELAPRLAAKGENWSRLVGREVKQDEHFLVFDSDSDLARPTGSVLDWILKSGEFPIASKDLTQRNE
jgi:hypothetical protein